MLRIKADKFSDEGFGDIEVNEDPRKLEQEVKDYQNYLAGVHMLNKLGFTNWGGIVKKLHDAYQRKGPYPETLDAFAKHHPSVKVLEEEFAKKDSPFNSPMFDKEHNISKDIHQQAREFMNPQVEKFEKKVEEKSKSNPSLLRDLKITKDAYINRPSRFLNKTPTQTEMYLDNKQAPKSEKSGEHAWFYKLTPEQQRKYKKEHNSSFAGLKLKNKK